MNPIIKNEYYKIVNSMTEEELNQMPNVSNKQYKKKLFGLIKNKDVKISVDGKEIIPHKLKLFSSIVIPHEIQYLEPSKNIKHDDKVIKICNHCDRGKINRGQYETKTRFVQSTHPGTYITYDMTQEQNDGTMKAVDSHYEEYKVSLEEKCGVCDGKWKTGFTFKDFLKYIKNFNEEIGKINKEIIEVNEKGSMLAEEYNDTIKKLNAKISIWNAKCPYNAIDKKHESDEDYFIYWGKSSKMNSSNNVDMSNTSSPRGSLPKGFE